MNYCGIDLHSNNCLIVVIDDYDKVLLEKRVPNDLAGILKLLAAYRHDRANRYAYVETMKMRGNDF